MNIVFYLSAAVAIISTAMVITRSNAVHALLYLIVSLLAAAVIFFVLGAPLIAALEVIIYAGAIMVLFVFVVMILNVTPPRTGGGFPAIPLRAWIVPAMLSTILIAEVAYVLLGGVTSLSDMHSIEPKEVAIAMFGPYRLGVELASLLLLAGLIGAYHLGRRDTINRDTTNSDIINSEKEPNDGRRSV
jgi:NADH-quinone oxidoreductase subunit J